MQIVFYLTKELMAKTSNLCQEEASQKFEDIYLDNYYWGSRNTLVNFHGDPFHEGWLEYRQWYFELNHFEWSEYSFLLTIGMLSNLLCFVIPWIVVDILGDFSRYGDYWIKKK